MNNITLTGNRGEWSEIYAFFKVLNDGVITTKSAQDYPVIKVRRMESSSEKIYSRIDDDRYLISTEDAPEDSKVVYAPDLKNSIRKIFQQIDSAEWAAFELPEMKDLMQKFDCRSIKSASQNKSDLIITAAEGKSGEVDLEFSIKSSIWGSPTLLNASSHTNFRFKVEWLDADCLGYLQSQLLKTKPLVKMIYEMGGRLDFAWVSSPNFEYNLKMSDFQLPVILGNLLVWYYRGLGVDMVTLASNLPNYAHGFDDELADVDYLVHKLKIFLENTALGMVPSKLWKGKLETTGGYLVVESTGEITCLHTYWRDLFKQYLFENTYLDTPSSGRHDFGYLLATDDGLFVDLNMQIRFKM